MLGDNRDDSGDFRVIGWVDRDRILGRAHAIAFSLDYEHHYAPRFDRFFERCIGLAAAEQSGSRRTPAARPAPPRSRPTARQQISEQSSLLKPSAVRPSSWPPTPRAIEQRAPRASRERGSLSLAVI